MNFVRDLRLIPVVALAAAALFVLKTASIVIDGGYTLIASRAALAQGLGGAATDDAMPPAAPLEDTKIPPRGDLERGWVRDISRAAEGATGATDAAPRATEGAPEYTGSVAAPKPEAAEKPADHAAAPAAADKPGAAPTPLESARPAMTAGERAVLESLQQRRQELDARAREIEVRDSLLKAAEKRIEQRVQELKELEGRITSAGQKKDQDEAAKFKSLVTMYENMKAKDAAKIFDRLDMRILVEVVNAMNPRRMADILGQMAPEAAERLTVEIANRSGALGKAPPQAAPAELPKIEGRPSKS